MRRPWHDSGIGGLGRHPVDPREMEAADAAGLVAAGAANVVETALEARDRADVLQFQAASRRLLQRGDDVALTEQRIFRVILTGNQAERRLQIRRSEPGRRWRNHAL